MKKLISLSCVSLLVVASQAWAWTMYYDGFAYEPPVSESLAITYDYDPLAYQLGDALTYTPFTPAGHPTTYADSPWVAFNNNAITSSWWPVIMPYNYDPPSPMPAATGHAIMIYGTANNQRKNVRISPTGASGPPFSVFTSGTLYYSLMVKVINCGRLRDGTYPDEPTVDPVAPGDFHAGFTHEPPDRAEAGVNGRFVTQGAALLRLRPTYGPPLSDSFQIGIQSNEPNAETSTSTVVWHSTGGDPFFGGTGSTPRFIVVSYEFRNNEPGPNQNLTDDICSLWINPDSSTFGTDTPPVPTLTTSGADATEIRSFFFRHGTSAGSPPRRISKALFDELRIGTTWAGVTSNVAPPCHDPRFDADGDRDVDQLDFAVYQACFTGTNDPGGLFNAEVCRCLNSDGDLDIDTDDRAAFEACASGPGIVADSTCDDTLPPPG